jgi:hypothetical protein
MSIQLYSSADLSIASRFVEGCIKPRACLDRVVKSEVLMPVEN